MVSAYIMPDNLLLFSVTLKDCGGRQIAQKANL